MPLHLSGGISEILRPLKKIGVPVDQIPIMMMVTLHFIPSLFMEGEKLIMAQKSRGFHLESYKILKNLRLAPALLIPLLRNAFRMADDLAMSLESRCYSGGDRTYLNELKFTKTDFIIIFFAIAMIPLIIVISL
jgi:energy-coupling factor transport system permease protein